jgi:CDP-diacylglycerol---glycerol-3-phosphate 3-phosphatidyltransferase
VAVNNLGKWKTATQMTALTFLLASRDPRYGRSFLWCKYRFAALFFSNVYVIWFVLCALLCSLPAQGVLVTSGVALLYVSAGLAIWSLVVYMRKIWQIILK